MKFVIGMLALILVLQGVSAAITFTGFPSTISQTSNSFSFTISGAENLTVDIGTNMGDISLTKKVNGTNVNVSYDISGYDFELLENFYYINVTATNITSGENDTKTTYFEADYCGNVYDSTLDKAELEIEITDLAVLHGFGEDSRWYPFDTVLVEIEVRNEGDWDLENIELEWAIYTESGTKIMDGEEDSFYLDEGDEEEFSFEIKLEDEIEEAAEEGNVILYVKATGKIDDGDAGDYDGDKICTFDKDDAKVVASKDFVIPVNLKINEQSVERDSYYESKLPCTSTVSIRGDVFNIGTNRQRDLELEIYNKELGLLKTFEFDKINSFDSEKFEYLFTIPENMTEGNYHIRLSVYDEDEDYFESRDDDNSVVYISFKIEGNCKDTTNYVAPTVNANLETEAKAGNEMNISTTIFNQNKETEIYTLMAEGFEDWAVLNSVKPTVIAVDGETSKQVTFDFSIKNSVSGKNTFNILVYKNDELIATQPVEVEVSKSQVTQEIGDFFKNETVQIIGIVVLDIILVLIIIFVVRKLVKKRKN